MRILTLVLLVLVIAGISAAPAAACATCFGDADAPATQGMNAAIGFMLGVIGLVQVAFVSLFVSFRKRARSLEERRERFKVLQGGLR